MAADAAKKQKPEAEVEEDIHGAFRGAANAASQLYACASANQKASFVSGERRAMESVYRWISSQLEGGREVSVADVLAYLQNEREGCRTEDVPGSSELPSSPLPAYESPPANVQSDSFSFGNLAAALKSQMGPADHARTAGISNSLPSNSHSDLSGQSSGYGSINSLPDGSGGRDNHSPPNNDSMDCNSHEPMNHDAS